MGKKKAQKTKELSVAIAEDQSAGDVRIQQQTQHESQTQLQSPRRRGRPRKIFARNESEEENKEQAADEAEQSEEEVGTIGVKYRSLLKRARTSDRHELEKSSEHKQDKDEEQEASEPQLLDISKEGTVAGAKEVTKREPSSSRAKRKSKPRKSSSK